MYKPYTFMIENTRYITLVGLEMNDTIKASDVVNYKNAMPFSVFMTSKINPKMVMEKQAGVAFNGLPMLQPKAYSEQDGVWNVQAEVEGKEFLLTEKAITIGGELICGEGSSTSSASVVEEPATVVEEHAPVEEAVTEEVIVQEEVKTVEVPAVEEAVKSPKAEVKQQTGFVESNDFYGIHVGGGKVKEEPFALGAAVVDSNLQIGVELVSAPTYTPPQRRRDYSETVRQAQPPKRYPWQRVDDIKETEQARPAQPIVPSGVPTVTPDIVDKAKTENAWDKNAQVDRPDVWRQLEQMAPAVHDQPVSIAPQEPVTAQVDENRELKEAFRSTLSPEINKIIGDIPHSILGPIEAFTTNDIDINQLNEQGDVYCIDRRWQKCGKWYCIDIVNHYSRYFYNSKLGVSQEIPTATCKEWLKIVSGAVQQ